MMRRIAAAVGVSTTALYVHFPDKDAILQAIAAAVSAELLGILEASQRDCGFVPDRLTAGLFRPGPSEPVAEAIWARVHGVRALLLDQAQHVTPPKRLVEQVIDMLVVCARV